MMHLTILTLYQNVTNRQTDGQTERQTDGQASCNSTVDPMQQQEAKLSLG